MENFNPRTQIAVIWSVDDVQTLRPELTDEQAVDVLRRAQDKHDANYGITWDVLESHAYVLYPPAP